MISEAPADITACDPSGCISEAKLATNIANTLAGSVVGYSLEVGGLAPRYGGLARTATDGSLAMEPDLVTNLASVSKTLSATAILQLLARNRLTPDTPISSYLYSDWTKGPNINLLTFRHLLTHTSGFAQTDSNCGAIPSGIDYSGLETIVANGVPNASYIGQGQYGNCNFALLRELMPALLGKTLLGYTNGSPRAKISSALYINYMNSHVFAPVSVPTSHCKPPAGFDILTYPFPAGTNPGTDWGDWSLLCGSGGWVLSPDQLFRVVNNLATGTSLLSTTEREQMMTGSLGWDSALRPDCPSPYVCKNGDLRDGAGRSLWTYAGILKCNVPVVLVVNSPLPSPYQPGEDIIGLVKDAFNASTVAGTPQACP
jgi:CubicO group peptidase (beta-lactamase class C family)